MLLLDGPNGAWAIALKTAWDTAQDATEFGQAATPIVTKLDGTFTPGSDGKTATVLLASDDATRESLQTALGQ